MFAHVFLSLSMRIRRIKIFCCTELTFFRYFKFVILLHAVARIALVKPEKAKGVEDVILRAAQMGQIAEKVYWILSFAATFLILITSCW